MAFELNSCPDSTPEPQKSLTLEQGWKSAEFVQSLVTEHKAEEIHFLFWDFRREATFPILMGTVASTKIGM